MKYALILSGFLRKEENLKNLKVWLDANSDKEIDIYINTYNVMGLQTKTSVEDEYAQEINRNTFLGLGNIAHFECANFTETQKYIKDLIRKEEIESFLSQPNIVGSIDKSKTSTDWEMNKLLSQFYMNYKNLQNLKNIKYDGVIKSRFDLNHNKLPSLEDDLQDGTVYGDCHKIWKKIPVIYDPYFIMPFTCIKSLIKSYDISHALDIIRERKEITEWKGGISCELTLSLSLFSLEGLKLSKIKSKVGINRHAKYR